MLTGLDKQLRGCKEKGKSMAPYVLLLGLFLTLSGCAGSTYSGYYGTYPYEEPYYYDYYDQLYGLPYSYPSPQYYYYSVPTFPAPGYFHREPEEHFEGHYKERGERGEHGGGHFGGEHRGGGYFGRGERH
jgi:hypothetical protein